MRNAILPVTMLCLCLALLAGCKPDWNDKQETVLTLTRIEEAFADQGIPLQPENSGEARTASVLSMPLNGVAPALFAIHDGQRIAVYLYASAKGVARAEDDFAEKTASADVIAHGRHAAANALVVYDYESSRSAAGKDIRVAQAMQALEKRLGDK